MSEAVITVEKAVGQWKPYRATGTVKSAHELLAPAGLGWEPEFRPLYTPDPHGGSKKVKNFRAVCRDDNGDTLGVVGNRYHLIKNKELADFCDALRATAEENSAMVHFGNAGYYKNGARPFIQLSRGNYKIGKYEVEDIISCFTAHDGSLNFTGGFSSTVIVCANTYAMALRDAKDGVVIRHTASAQDRLEEIHKVLAAAAKYRAAFNNTALALMNKKFTDQNLAALAAMLYPGDKTRAKSAREEFFKAYYGAAGADPGTAWGAMQAVTYIVNHERGTRAVGGRSEEEARSESIWMGSGRAMTEKAWWTLTDDAAMAKMMTQFNQLAA